MKKTTKLLTLLSASTLFALSLSNTNNAAAEESSKATVSFSQNNTKPGIVNPNNPTENTDLNNANPDDPDNKGTTSPGPLSIDYVSNFDFGTKTISSKKESYKLSEKDGKASQQTPFIQVTDNRGNQAGWNLTAKITDFTSNDDNNKTLKGAKLTIGSKSRTATGAYGNENTAPTVTTPFVFSDNNQAQSIMTATSGAGAGTWLDLIDPDTTTLDIPAGNASATKYSATITWNISDGPQNATATTTNENA